MEFASEYIEDIIEEMLPLTLLHHKEVDLFGHELDINWETYIEEQLHGRYALFTVRQEGKLVGYSGFSGFNHTHHKNVLHAKQDILFIHPDYRGKGVKFIRYCEDRLRGIGIKIIHQSVPASNDWSAILDRLGYDKIETVYAKEL